jgi:hypothetical protein
MHIKEGATGLTAQLMTVVCEVKAEGLFLF